MSVRSLLRSAARLARRDGSARPLVIIASGQESADLPKSLRGAIADTLGRGAPVELLVLDFTSSGEPTIPDEVVVRRFWRDATPGIGGFVPPDFNGLSPAPVPNAEGGWRPGYYSDGLPVARVETSPAGMVVNNLTTWGAVTRRVELDARGCLVRIVDVDPDTSEDVTHRYIADDGSCWLSVPLNGDRPTGPVRQFEPSARTYSTLDDAHAAWACERLPERARVVSAGPAGEQVIRRLQRVSA